MSQNPLALSTTGPLPGLTAVSGINGALDSLSRWLSGPTAPTAAGLGLSSLAGMVWHDTAANTLKVRDQADSAWITVGSFDEANKLFQAAYSVKTDGSLRQSASGLSVNEPMTLISANQTITASSHFANLVASAAVTLTLAQTSTLGNGACAFSLSAQGGAVTLAPNAADSIVVGQTIQAAGASYVLAQGASTFVVCDGAGKWYLLFLNSPVVQPPAFKNRVINGGMKIAQRGTGATITTVNTSAYTVVDRFVAYQASPANFVFQQSPLAGNYPFTHCVRVQRPAGNTSTSALAFGQAIASANCSDLAGQKVTLSFYAYGGADFSPANGRATAWLTSGTGIDQSFSAMTGVAWTGQTSVFSTAFTVTPTITRYSFTGTVPANATQLGFMVTWSPVGTAGANDTLYITGVQLEEGGVATPFEALPFDIDLQRCLPYFQKTFDYSIAPAQNTGNSMGVLVAQTMNAVGVPNVMMLWRFPVMMRATPSVQIFTLGTNTAYQNCICDNVTFYSTVGLHTVSQRSISFYNGGTGLAANTWAYAHATVSAEL